MEQFVKERAPAASLQNRPEPWRERIAWYWYGDREVFHCPQEYFDEKIRALKEQGVTTVINFGTTHYRMSFYPYWEEICACIHKIAKACHKYGLRSVEHHSATLLFNTSTIPGWEHLHTELCAAREDTSLDSWIRIYPYLSCNPRIGGKSALEFTQIDAQTGKPPENPYHCRDACINNPDYRTAYFGHVRDLCAAGIDGIMNDDVQYFADACACPHCRKLFFEQTGQELPEAGDWEGFYGNYQNPLFIAWKRFRLQSTERFYRDLTALYDSLGLALFRPNYSSDVLIHNQTAYPFERCGDLWDLIFQENSFSSIIRQSFLHYQAEAVHRYALAERRGVPSMSQFYPNRADTVYFSWALARSWGQLYTGTYDAMDLTPLEKPLRDFEQANAAFLDASQKRSDLAFYFSESTRDFTSGAEETMRAFTGKIQAAYVSGYRPDMVFENDSLEELSRHKAILAASVRMVGKDELDRLHAYVRQGGRLILTGDFAVLDRDGGSRSLDAVAKALGLAGNEALEAQQTPRRHRVGAGEIWIAKPCDEDEFQPSIWAFGRLKGGERVPAVLSKWEIQQAGTGALLRQILGSPRVRVSCGHARIVATDFRVPGGLAVHLVNLEDTVSEARIPVGHDDPLPHFQPGSDPLPAMELTLPALEGRCCSRAELRTPEREDAAPLEMVERGEDLCVAIPGGLFSGYALICLW